MKNAVELNLSTAIVAATPAAYAADKLTLHTGLVKETDASQPFFGPRPPALLRPSDAFASGAAGTWMGNVIPYTNEVDWVIQAENPSTAAAVKIFTLATYNRVTRVWTAVGRITATFPAVTLHIVRGVRALYQKYTTGTVAVAGTAVTGVGTAWVTARQCVGSRIGFGSINPAEITQWYDIGAIATDTGLTLTSPAGTIAAGTPFVIEDLQLVVATTNATLTNGGLHVIKGLSYATFQPSPTVIPAATTVDRIRAVYWLKDAATVLNTISGGVALGDFESWTSQKVYITDGAATTLKIYVYNPRAPLTVLGGASVDGFVLSTANFVVIGTLSQNDNGFIATLGHSAAAGVQSLFLFTTTRIYRAALSNITSGSTTFLSDTIAEVPPGGINTYAIMSIFLSVGYCPLIDRFIVQGSAGGRMYLTKWRTDGSQWDRIFAADGKVYNSSLSDVNMPVVPGLRMATNLLTFACSGGMLYMSVAVATQLAGAVFAVDLSAEMDAAATTLQRAITPVMSTAGATKLHRVYIAHASTVGAGAHVYPTGEYLVYYRTSGISDNLGSWTLINDSGDLSGVIPGTEIQFMFEFRICNISMAPTKIYDVVVTYDADVVLPGEFRWSLSDSNNTNGTVGFKQISAFGSLTSLAVTYHRVDNNLLVLEQNSGSTTYGTFEYWTGAAWAAGLGANIPGTRRRFVPSTGLPAGVPTYAKITKV